MRYRRMATGALPLVVAGAFIIATAGCASEPPPHWHHGPDWVQVHFEGGDLSSLIAVDPPIVGRDRRGQLVVTVPMRSTTGRAVWVDASAQFFDHDGNSFGARLRLGAVAIEPYGASRLTFISPTPRAEDFQLFLRPAR
jgi:hypothetical protein